MSRRHFGLILAWLSMVVGACAHADVIDAANWARVKGCGPTRNPLRLNDQLGHAAQLLAAGASLQSSLLSVRYLASRSSVIHVTGAISDARLTSVLSSRYCLTLADQKLAELGVYRLGNDLWLVLAAPLALPEPREMGSVAQRILALVNLARTGGRRCGAASYPPAPPLKMNAALAGAALTHSQSMAHYEQFDHRGHDGSVPATRVQRAGYGPHILVGENIAAGMMTPEEVTQGWLQSAPHCENIMDARFTDIGIAYAVNPDSPELVYWTQDFAAPRRVGEANRSK